MLLGSAIVLVGPPKCGGSSVFICIVLKGGSVDSHLAVRWFVFLFWLEPPNGPSN